MLSPSKELLVRKCIKENRQIFSGAPKFSELQHLLYSAYENFAAGEGNIVSRLISVMSLQCLLTLSFAGLRLVPRLARPVSPA